MTSRIAAVVYQAKIPTNYDNLGEHNSKFGYHKILARIKVDDERTKMMDDRHFCRTFDSDVASSPDGRELFSNMRGQ